MANSTQAASLLGSIIVSTRVTIMAHCFTRIVWPCLTHFDSMCDSPQDPLAKHLKSEPSSHGNAPPDSPLHVVSRESWQHPDVHRQLIGVRQSILPLVGTGCSATTQSPLACLLRIILRKYLKKTFEKKTQGISFAFEGTRGRLKGHILKCKMLEIASHHTSSRFGV